MFQPPLVKTPNVASACVHVTLEIEVACVLCVWVYQSQLEFCTVIPRSVTQKYPVLLFWN